MFFFQKQRYFKKLHLKKPTVYVMPGLHFDPLIHPTQAQSTESAIQLLRQYVQACRVDPFYGFAIPDANIIKPYLDIYPDDKTFLKQLVAQERCSVSGNFTQICQTLAGGEALIRNFVLGKAAYESWFNGQTPVFMAWDSFSHVPQLPQMMEQCGLKVAIFNWMQGQNADHQIPGMEPLFLWNAPNGSEVYAYRVQPKALDDIPEEIDKTQASKSVALQNVNADLLFDAASMLPPSPNFIGTCKEWSQGVPPVHFTGKAVEHFFSAIDTKLNSGKNNLGKHSRDFSSGSEGTDISRMDLNIACRVIENTLFELEALSVYWNQYGFNFSSPVIQNAWQQLLYCQQHSGLGGWCSDITYIELISLCQQTLSELISLRDEWMSSFTSNINTIDIPGEPIQMFNVLPWRRDGVCSVIVNTPNDIDLYQLTSSQGESIPYELEEMHLNEDGSPNQVKLTWVEPDIPSAGYQTISLQSQSEPQNPYIQIAQSQTWLENDFIRLEIDRDMGGGITSITDKTTGFEYIQSGGEYPANDVLCFKESSDESSPQHLFTTGKRSAKSDHPAFIDYYESPISQSLMIKGHGPGPCRAIQEIKLYHDLPFIDCVTILDNYQGYGKPNDKPGKKHQRDMYALHFPLNLPGASPVLEDRFYAKSCPRSLGNYDFRASHKGNLSKHAMNTFHRWVDVSWSFLVRIIKNKTETGGITVGPSEIITSHEWQYDLQMKLMMHLSRHGVTCTSKLDTQKAGEDHLICQTSFSIGSVDDNVYTKNLLDRIPEAREYYDRSMDEFGYVVMIVPDHWGEMIRPVFIFAGNDQSMTDQAVDEMIHSTIAHRWDCPESACFMPDLPVVSDAGFAFLHQSGSVCSLEENGSLLVGLMRAAPYHLPLTKWGLEMAEQKTHVFNYRLIPHEGDWRHAEIPRRAMEYQHKPICSLSTKQQGTIETSDSLFSIEPSNVLVSTIKEPGFEPKNDSVLFGNSPQAVLRVYEAHGEESNLWIESPVISKKAEVVLPDETVVKGNKEIFWEEGSIRTIIHANEISAFRIPFKQKDSKLSIPKSEEEPDSSISMTRYWKYNMGSVSNSNTPVRVTLRGQLPQEFGSKNCVAAPVQVIVSNHSSSSVEGVVEFEVPDYWRMIPQQKKYQLPEDGFVVIPALVVADKLEANGVIRAKTVCNNGVIEDEMTVGQTPSFDVEMTLTAEAFFIHLSHHFPYTIQGNVEIILPVETWAYPLMKNCSLSWMSPKQISFQIAPEKKQSMEFNIHDYENRFQIATDHHWLVVKVSAHYCNWYYHVRLDGRPSGGLGCVVQS